MVVIDVSIDVFLIFGVEEMIFPDFFIVDDDDGVSSIISSSSSELSFLAKK